MPNLHSRSRAGLVLLTLALSIPVLSLPTASAVPSPCDVIIAGGTHFTSLQDAVDATTDGAVLRVKGTCTGHTEIDHDVTIVGRKTKATGAPRLSGGGTVQVLLIDVVANVTIKNLMIRDGLATGGFPADSGGGIGNDGTLVLNNVVIRNNEGRNGGGISNRGTLTLRGYTKIHHNVADDNNGGGIDNDGTFRTTTLTMNGHSSVFRNSAGANGGGVNLWDSSLTMNAFSSIHNNTSPSGGGVFEYCGSTATGLVVGSNVFDNTPTNYVAEC
jgi:hypothetical protein